MSNISIYLYIDTYIKYRDYFPAIFPHKLSIYIHSMCKLSLYARYTFKFIYCGLAGIRSINACDDGYDED